MRKYSVVYSDAIYDFLVNNASEYTIKELVNILENKYDFVIEKKKLAQYCIKMGINYKYEKPNKAHSNKSTPVGVIVRKTDGDMLKVKVDNHKWEYLQRKIYEDYYNTKLPDDVYVIFLNQDKRDFSIDNLMPISRRTSAIMSKNGLFSSNEDITKLGILTAELDIKRRDLWQN